MLSKGKHEQQESAADFGYGFSTVQNPAWNLAQVVLATGGRLLGDRTSARFRSVVTDSRLLEPGDLFLAIKGEKYDGHAFLNQAILKGASGLVVERQPDFNSPVPLILVADSLKALGDLAGFRRRLMSDLLVLGITGSSGKTTVKEMTAAIFEQRYNVLKTKGNFNNLIGLPLSLLPVDFRHKVAVLEMGMNRPGEIARLTEIADPDLGCIVNVQEAHLEGLGNIGGVAKAKGELFSGIKPAGKLAVNIDDPEISKLAKNNSNQQISFGRSQQAYVRATRIRNNGEKGMSFTLNIGEEKARVTIPAIGAHNVMNALAASALAAGAGITISEIARGLAAFKPYEKRMQVEILPCGLKLVNDTYNANPSSMCAALEALQGMRRKNSRSVAILGDMLELGEKSIAAHRYIGKSVGRLGFDYLLSIGNFAGHMVNGAQEAGMTREQSRVCANKEEAAGLLLQLYKSNDLATGDWLLLKGSRGMRMETIIAPLMQIGAGE